MVGSPNRGRLGEQLIDIAEAFTEIGLRVSASTTTPTFEAIVNATVELVPGGHAASITQLTDGRFETVAATSQFAVSADKIQYDLGAGPCIDAILEQAIYRPRDVRTDRRWPEFGRQVAGLGVSSMLSYRMTADGGTLAGLNVYSADVDAFDDTAAAIGLLLATHGALAVSAAAQRTRSEQLFDALTANRQVGEAVGILMATHRLTENQALDLLRIASQNTNRALHDIAADLVETRRLDVVPALRDPRHPGDDAAPPA